MREKQGNTAVKRRRAGERKKSKRARALTQVARMNAAKAKKREQELLAAIKGPTPQKVKAKDIVLATKALEDPALLLSGHGRQHNETQVKMLLRHIFGMIKDYSFLPTHAIHHVADVHKVSIQTLYTYVKHYEDTGAVAIKNTLHAEDGGI